MPDDRRAAAWPATSAASRLVLRNSNSTIYNSNEGILTAIFGPIFWTALHLVSFNFPVTPTREQQNDYRNWFLSTGKVLPCVYCRNAFLANAEEAGFGTQNVFASRDAFSRFCFRMHAVVNSNLGKPNVDTFEQVRHRYEAFRAQCAPATQVRASIEQGCVEPLHKKAKGRCVINVVPQSTAVEESANSKTKAKVILELFKYLSKNIKIWEADEYGGFRNWLKAKCFELVEHDDVIRDSILPQCRKFFGEFDEVQQAVQLETQLGNMLVARLGPNISGFEMTLGVGEDCEGTLERMGYTNTGKSGAYGILYRKGRNMAAKLIRETHGLEVSKNIGDKIHFDWRKLGGGSNAETEYGIAQRMGDLEIGPKVHELIPCNGAYIMTMDFVDGKEFAALSDAEKEAVTPKVESLILKMHENGYMHTDLHGGNIMVREDGSPLLIDFGRARTPIDLDMQKLKRAMRGTLPPPAARIKLYKQLLASLKDESSFRALHMTALLDGKLGKAT